jgi:Cu2+-exporting ATPase
MNGAAAALPHTTLRLGFRDDPGLVDLVTHRVRADRYELELEVPDMRCANCAGRIEQALTALDGVSSVRINPARHLVMLDYDPTRVSLGAMLDAITDAGYTPAFVARSVDDPRLVAQRRAELKRLAVAGFAMMQVMMFSLPLYVAHTGGMNAFYQALFRWSALIFSTPVVFYCAAPFFRNAAASVAHTARGAAAGATSGLAMDVPVALAIAVAYAASVIATVSGHGDVYYDSVTMFTFLLLGARFLEQQTRHRLARFDNWLALLPEWASRATVAGVERIALVDIRPGDRIVVASGSRIPIDGAIVDGATQVDESALTGESRPVDKAAGQRAFAGTMNLAQPITIVADTRPAQTRVAEIHRLAQRASLEKPPIALLADRIAQRFVAAILLIAAATFVVWQFIDPVRALPAAIAVLVVSCPCALSLATPTAITAAAMTLRRFGFVITRAHVIERLAAIGHVVFDKTGTLTGGKAELVAVETTGGLSRTQSIDIAHALESRSSHPLAQALRDSATRQSAHVVQSVRIEPGKGIQGIVDGVAYRLGNAEFCAARGAAGHGELSTFYLATMNDGAPTVVAEFGVRMALRDDVATTIATLNDLGISSEIVSGDGIEPTREVSRQLGGIAFTARVTPEAKLAHVLELRAQGKDVAMVGDGINDVPGLAAAAVSITTADATDLAKSTSDAILLAPGIGGIARALDIARRARGIIRENLVWAAAYNLVAIPLAVAGFVPPWVAAIGMSVSSLGVTLNAMRLGLRDKIPRKAPNHAAKVR